MKNVFVLLGLSCLGLCQGQATAQERDKAKVPAPYLSIGEFYARRDAQAVPPRIMVAGYYHNYTRQTVSGAMFSIERWNGTTWVSIKSGRLNPVAANKPGAESVSLPLTNSPMKFRFVVSPSVEVSKQAELRGADVRTKADPAKAKGGLDLGSILIDTATEYDPKRPKTKFEFLKLSIDQFYANRYPGGILIGALMSNKNQQATPESPYAIYQWRTGAGSSGWTKIKSGTLKSVKANGSVFESASLPASNDAMKFKIEVSESVQWMKECSLQRIKEEIKVFVVQYRCPEWQILPGWRDRTPLAASQRMKGLNKLGFSTKYSYVTNDYLIDRSTHLTVYYQSVGWQERTFPTRAAAEAFQNSREVDATQPNREYADILPKPGVEVKIVER